jgi:predicted transcriptional regulator
MAKRGRKPDLKRRKQATDLRREGLSFPAIGKRMGVTHQAAWQLVNGPRGERRKKS